MSPATATPLTATACCHRAGCGWWESGAAADVERQSNKHLKLCGHAVSVTVRDPAAERREKAS